MHKIGLDLWYRLRVYDFLLTYQIPAGAPWTVFQDPICGIRRGVNARNRRSEENIGPGLTARRNQ